MERRIFGNHIYADVSFLISTKILTTCLNHILQDLAGEKYEMLKLGFYSCAHF